VLTLKVPQKHFFSERICEMSRRIEKVESLIKEEISLIFLRKLQDPAFGFLTVTNVKLSPDLRIAKVYISVFEKEKRESSLEKVKLVSGYIRSELASKIRIKFIPELKFFIDDTLDYVEKIEGLIKKIHKDDNKENE
jgi:ribosome-binding factor A